MFGRKKEEKTVSKAFNKRRKKERKLEKEAEAVYQGLRAAAALVPDLNVDTAVTAGRPENNKNLYLSLMLSERGGYGVEITEQGKYMVFVLNGEGVWDHNRRTVTTLGSRSGALKELTNRMMDKGFIPVRAALPGEKKPFTI